jgi:hypothetical protein
MLLFNHYYNANNSSVKIHVKRTCVCFLQWNRNEQATNGAFVQGAPRRESNFGGREQY